MTRPKNPNRVAAGKVVSGHHARKTCRHCRRPFLGTGKQVYCSRGCKEAAQLVARTPIACVTCGKPVGGRKGQRFCSAACKGREPLAPRERVCATCQRPFSVGPKSAAKYCSPNCRAVAQTAAKLLARTGSSEQQAAALAAELENRK